ncbi:Transposase, Ptta/En/Spm, plant [Corchorus olitorius]|uniref:Transposase, Ptta/En/Spm, plant n=1 Tax=Corchorus olitorius TaxID=93759 RepID=A0A1R3GVH6_9ROSI|nr:Transposase, Ptta/En/Spm, plant [Corchorus olitorius]
MDDRPVRDLMRSKIQENFNGAWPIFSKILEKDVKHMFEHWKAHFTYDDNYDEAIFKEFKDVGSKHLSKIFAIQRGKLHSPKPEWVLDWAWEEMKAYWRFDAFKKLSEINKNNRASKGGSAGYYGGSITIGAHVDLLTVKLKNPPEQDYLYRYLHSKEGVFPESEKIIQEAVKEAIQAAGDDQEDINRINKLAIWASVAKNSKEHTFGLGNLVKMIPKVCATPIMQKNTELQERVKQLEGEIAKDMLRDALAQIGCQHPQFPQFLAYTNIGQSSGSFEQPPSQPSGSQSGDRSSP